MESEGVPETEEEWSAHKPAAPLERPMYQDVLLGGSATARARYRAAIGRPPCSLMYSSAYSPPSTLQHINLAL